MSKIFSRSLVFTAFTPFISWAAVSTINDAIDVVINIFTTLIPILLSLMIAVFFWGLIKFIYHADDEKAVEEGKAVMIWGVIGIGVVALLWGIVGYLQASFGLNVSGGVGDPPAIPTTIPAS